MKAQASPEPSPARLAYTAGMTRLSGRLRIWALGLVLLSLTAMSVLPTLARVAAGARALPWAELCRGGVVTAAREAGDTRAAQDSRDSGDPAQAPATPAHLFDHCPYCSVHSDALPPGPPALALPPAGLPAYRTPAAFLHAPGTLHAWDAARARAPPLMA